MNVVMHLNQALQFVRILLPVILIIVVILVSFVIAKHSFDSISSVPHINILALILLYLLIDEMLKILLLLVCFFPFIDKSCTDIHIKDSSELVELCLER